MNNPNESTPGPEYISAGPSGSGPTGTGPSGSGPSGRSGGGKKAAVLGVAALAVVAVVGAGGWAATQLMSGGSSPAAAVPSNAAGYVSLDLDPSASQKIEAIKILQKFPGIEKELDVDSKDDLRQWVFDKLKAEETCESLDYADDVEPWIGDRIALAAVPAEGDEVAPLIALQVTDEGAAEKGFATIMEACDGDDSDTATALTEDYLLISDTQAHADSMAKGAEESPLADDDDFKDWMDEVGDAGIITMYAAPEALSLIQDLSSMEGAEPLTGSDGLPGSGVLGMLPPSELNGSLEEAAEDFEGGAGVVRFQDGGVEAEIVGKGVAAELTEESSAPSGAQSLPATTGAVLSIAFRDGWLEDALDSMKDVMGESEVQSFVDEAAAQTGLSIPEDVETLLGDGISLAVDPSTDFKQLSQTNDLSELSAGLRIQGDPDEIMPVLDKVMAAAGPAADELVVEQGDDAVVLGFSDGYTDELSESGDLGGTKPFETVVPAADRANMLFFVDFDAGEGWAERLAQEFAASEPEVAANIAPLDAFGFSVWGDSDGVQHALLRLTTD